MKKATQKNPGNPDQDVQEWMEKNTSNPKRKPLGSKISEKEAKRLADEQLKMLYRNKALD